jgi:glycerol-3-phosphate cytidylyltransferase-like family protein
MSDGIPTSQYHSNRYNAQAACEHCEGVIRHEKWCITLDPIVYYAFQVVADPTKLTLGDSLMLHSLGVIWEGKKCQGGCKTNTSVRSGTKA